MTPSKPQNKPRKKLIRRTDRDYSQALRRGYQFAFLLLNVWLGGQFYLWVRHFETAGQSPYVPRPAGVEGWLPIAGMMNLKYFLVTRHNPALHPAAMFLLVTFLAISFLFRKAFCGWLCPVGTVSEYLGKPGKKLFGRNFHLPRWVDIPLRGLKYLLLGFFVWAVSSISANAIAAFLRSPYGIVADVKMLNFSRFSGETGLIVLGVLVVASVFVQNFWCRYLCPYGVLLGITSLFSPLRIHRNLETCIDSEVREGLSLEPASGPTADDQVGRVHRMPGVCRGLPRGRCAADGAATDGYAADCETFAHVGLRGRSGCLILWHHRIFEDGGLLDVGYSSGRVPATRAARKRSKPSHARRSSAK